MTSTFGINENCINEYQRIFRLDLYESGVGMPWCERGPTRIFYLFAPKCRTRFAIDGSFCIPGEGMQFTTQTRYK